MESFLGMESQNSAIAVGLDYQYVKKIVKKYNELGASGVKIKGKNLVTIDEVEPRC
jgi:hypothetical protein